MKRELGNPGEKLNEFDGKLRKVEAKFGCRRIRLNNLLVKHGHLDKLLRGVIEQSFNVFKGPVQQLNDRLVTSFRVGLEKAYSDNLIQCLVTLAHGSKTFATRVSCRSDSEDEAESGLSCLEGQRGGRSLRPSGIWKCRGLRYFISSINFYLFYYPLCCHSFVVFFFLQVVIFSSSSRTLNFEIC